MVYFDSGLQQLEKHSKSCKKVVLKKDYNNNFIPFFVLEESKNKMKVMIYKGFQTLELKKSDDLETIESEAVISLLSKEHNNFITDAVYNNPNITDILINNNLEFGDVLVNYKVDRSGI